MDASPGFLGKKSQMIKIPVGSIQDV